MHCIDFVRKQGTEAQKHRDGNLDLKSILLKNNAFGQSLIRVPFVSKKNYNF